MDRAEQLRDVLKQVITIEFSDVPKDELSEEVLGAAAITALICGLTLQDTLATVEAVFKDMKAQILHLHAGQYNSDTPEA